MEESVGLAPDNHDIVGALLSDAITEDDIVARKYDGARIRHYVVNWSAPEENLLMQTYLFGEIAREDGVFKAELKSLVATLDRTNLQRFERRCNANLGDQRCGVKLDPDYASTATITRMIDPATFEISGIEEFESGWFTSGHALVLTRQNADFSIEIASHIADENAQGRVALTLWATPPHVLQVGDEIKLHAGCDKQFSTCKSKFGNAANFRGFPHMPGNEFATSYAANTDLMDGSPLFP